MSGEWITPYLKAIASGSTHSEACDAAGCAYGTPRSRAKTDPDFRAALEDAHEASADVLEREARRRAIDGVEEPVIYKGEPTYLYEVDEAGNTIYDIVQQEVPDFESGAIKLVPVKMPRKKLDANGQPMILTVRKPSDTLLALLLKGRRPEVFGTERTQLSGPGGGPIETAEIAGDANKRAARLAALVRMAEERKRLADDAAPSIDDIA